MSMPVSKLLSSPSLDLWVFQVRGHSVMLDGDLAALYGVSTTVFNQAIKRNLRRFPPDFVFQPTRQELANLKSQIVISKTGGSKSVFEGHGGARTLPWVFTEHGAIMAAMILRSERAATMSVYVVRAFVRMRREFQANVGLEKRLTKIENTLLVHDAELREVYAKIKSLLLQPGPEASRKEMGFHVHLKKS